MSMGELANDMAAGVPEGVAGEGGYWSRAADITPARLEKALRPLVCTDPAHDWWHVERVFRMGLRLFCGLREDAGPAAELNGLGQPWNGYPPPDPEWGEAEVRVALLCHDMGPKAGGGPNALVEVPQLWAVLEKSGVRLPSPSMIEAVDAINAHSWTRGAAARTVAQAVVQDADRLDAIGAIGVARCLAFNGHKGRPIHDPAAGPGALTSLGHFQDKLLKIRARLNLPESRRLAAKRDEVLGAFRDRLLAEWEGLA